MIKLLPVLCIGLLCHPLHAKYRTFTDNRGRTMEARITRVSGEDVYFELKGGLTAKVNINILSEPDREYVKTWERDKLLKDGAFEVRLATKTTSKSDYVDVPLSRGYRGILERTWQQHYEIIVTNTTYEDFSDVRIEYLVMKFEDKPGAEKRSEGEIKRKKGDGRIQSLPSRSEQRIKTEPVLMRETKPAPNYAWPGGRKQTSEDDMRGIWVKIYVDDKFVQEYSKPGNLKNKEVW